jgi:hypothetical protein
MSGALLRRRGYRRLQAGPPARKRLTQAAFRPVDHVARLRASALVGDGADALTLDDLITNVWQALGEWETGQCPLCGGEIGRSRKTVSRSVAEEVEPHGECVDCGTRLS